MNIRPLKFAALFCLAIGVCLQQGQGWLNGHEVRAQRPANKNTDSFHYGGGLEGIRYSSLRQINRENVQNLEIAWTFDSSEGPGEIGRAHV